MQNWSVRAQLTARRSYHRPLDMDNPVTFETWPQVITRVIQHQRWLWERALHRELNREELLELDDLYLVMLDRKALVAGRTLWLGGTEISRQRECSQFNCAFLQLRTIHDMVDAFWLLLNGCGVAGTPVPGSLFGFSTPISRVECVVSSRGPLDRGRGTNTETYNRATKSWTISVGDSAEAWAKVAGKLLAGKHRGCESLTLDFSQIRGPGSRLRGYGWIGAGYKPLADALVKIAELLNRHAGAHLPFEAIHDIFNLLGTVLSTRRSAELVLCPSTEDDATLNNFVKFKADMYDRGVSWREQSNNTVDWWERPSLEEIRNQLEMMWESGGSEPGIRNARAALARAPWQKGTNPCAEILLPDKGFCNLVEPNWAHPEHIDNPYELADSIRLIARANYRQTLVNLHDGILQRAWHENNENLRLCGVGGTGIAQVWESVTPTFLDYLRQTARSAAIGMADELGTQRPALVTTVKPSGTLSKVMDCTEGFHYPLARYILNKIVFPKSDPLVEKMRAAGIEIEPHPSKESDVLASIPVDQGVEPVRETAVQQLDRYKLLMENWCDHNVSCTIYYDGESELDSIAQWLHSNWDAYVAVSFLPRPPELPAADQAAALGYAYLPQSVLTKEQYDALQSRISPISFDDWGQLEAPADPATSVECAGGSCPIR